MTRASADTAAFSQFLTFTVGGECFALPLDRVREVLRPPRLVPVPLTPASLKGLANVRGSVLAVVDCPRLLGLDRVAADDQQGRVLVVDGGLPVGLAVHAVSRLVATRPEAVTAALALPVKAEMLSGVLRDAESGRAVMILDLERLLARDFAELDTARAVTAVAAAPGPAAAAGAATEAAVAVAFEAAGQEFALPIGHVREIARLPGTLIRLPHVGAPVLGVASRRDGLLALVSLAGLLGLQHDQPPAEGAKVVVVAVDGEVVGLVVDRPRAVLRLERARLSPISPLLGNGDPSAQLDAIARLGEGRLVSLLSPSGLFRHRAVRHAITLGQQEQASMDTPGSGGTAEQFVIFRLGDEEYGVPILAIEEIMRPPATLTRVPKTPSFIAGVVNRRGTALPVIDQRRRFELAPASRDGRQRIIVFTVDGVTSGFLVDAVVEVLSIAPHQLGPAPRLSAEQARLIGRVANLEAQQRIILLLDVAHLLSRKEAGALARARWPTDVEERP